MRKPVVLSCSLLFCTTAALGQESAPATPPQTRPSAPESRPAGPSGRVVLEARAVNYSAMLKTRHGAASENAPPVPLPDLDVVILVEAGADGAPNTVKARTDASGNFRADLGPLPAGARVELLAGTVDEGSRLPGYYARSWFAGKEPAPTEVRFYQVARAPDGIRQTVMQIATVQGEGKDRFIRVRQTIQALNYSFEVWLGDPTAGSVMSFQVPFAEGFKVESLEVNKSPVQLEIQRLVHGGQGYLFRAPIFPTIAREDLIYSFLAILTRPYAEGETYELGFHVEYPVVPAFGSQASVGWTLSLEEPGLQYVPPDAANRRMPLAFDMGVNPPMGNNPKATHTWGVEHVPAHTDVGAAFRMGKPPISGRTFWVIGAIVAIAAGAIGLGLHFGSRRGSAAMADSPAGQHPALLELDRLERRRAAGEITSVEYEARRAMLVSVLAAGSPAAATGAGTAAGGAGTAGGHSAGTAAGAADLRRALDRIVERPVDRGDVRAEDIRTLARALRELVLERGG